MYIRHQSPSGLDILVLIQIITENASFFDVHILDFSGFGVQALLQIVSYISVYIYSYKCIPDVKKRFECTFQVLISIVSTTMC